MLSCQKGLEFRKTPDFHLMISTARRPGRVGGIGGVLHHGFEIGAELSAVDVGATLEGGAGEGAHQIGIRNRIDDAARRRRDLVGKRFRQYDATPRQPRRRRIPRQLG